jgi:hypothetical protein
MISFRRLFSPLSILSALAIVIMSTAATGAAPESENRWQVDYGDTKCRLIRHFGAAGQKHRLEIERDWAFGGYRWGLHGAELPVYSSTTTIEVTRAGTGASRVKADSYVAREGEEKAIKWHDADGLFFDALRDDEQIRFKGPQKLDVSLSLPRLSAAVEALETCENKLFGNWGVDADQFRSLSVKAEPSNNAGRWVTNDDYPRADLVRKNEGRTTFLLTVGADGATTACRIVGSSGFSSLDTRTCELILSRSAFHPAKDAAGRAVPSFYINTVRWQVPR